MNELSIGFGLAPPYPGNMIATGFVRAAIHLVLLGVVYRFWIKRMSETAA